MEFHRDGTLPNRGEIFVFGSNQAGRHGAGAALIAAKRYGAVRGVPFGLQGQSFAIPTKNKYLQTLSVKTISLYVQKFIDYNFLHFYQKFFITRVGCGLAGLKDEQIAPLFRGAVNCSFPEQWEEYLI